MNDRLYKIFEIQKTFEEKFLNFKNVDFKNITLEEKQQWTKEWLLCLIVEATEVLNEINWKNHKLTDKNVIESNLVEELIDVFKYYLAIVVLWNINDEKFFDEFERKSVVVSQKFEQEKLFNISLNKDSKVCALDIDGILYPWPEAFLEYASNYSPYMHEGQPPLKHYSNLYDFEKEPLKKQLFLKEQYRLSGTKARAGVLEGAIEFTKALKEKGYTIILLTARPYKKYTQIYTDTLQWLTKHNIQFDAIIWEQEKEKYLIEKFPNVMFVVDDDYNNAVKLRKAGIKTYLKNTIYNIDKEFDLRFDKLEQLLNKV